MIRGKSNWVNNTFWRNWDEKFIVQSGSQNWGNVIIAKTMLPVVLLHVGIRILNYNVVAGIKLHCCIVFGVVMVKSAAAGPSTTVLVLLKVPLMYSIYFRVQLQTLAESLCFQHVVLNSIISKCSQQ